VEALYDEDVNAYDGTMTNHCVIVSTLAHHGHYTPEDANEELSWFAALVNVDNEDTKEPPVQHFTVASADDITLLAHTVMPVNQHQYSPLFIECLKKINTDNLTVQNLAQHHDAIKFAFRKLSDTQHRFEESLCDGTLPGWKRNTTQGMSSVELRAIEVNHEMLAALVSIGVMSPAHAMVFDTVLPPVELRTVLCGQYTPAGWSRLAEVLLYAIDTDTFSPLNPVELAELLNDERTDHISSLVLASTRDGNTIPLGKSARWFYTPGQPNDAPVSQRISDYLFTGTLDE
jgi:hypothetical protein